VDHLTAAAQDLNPNEFDDMGPLLLLIHELVRYASNMHQLTCEQQSGQQQPPPPNPYIRSLPGSGGSPSSSGSGGGGGGGAGGGVHAILPAAAYAKLLQPSFLKLCVHPYIIMECGKAADLGALLTWGNRDVSLQLLYDAAYGYNVLKARFPSLDGGLAEVDWCRVCRRLNAAVLQPDQFAEERINGWLMGRFERPPPGSLQLPKQHLALLSYEGAISWGCLAAFKALGLAAEDLFQSLKRDGRGKVLEALAVVLAIHSAKVQGDFSQLLDFAIKQPSILTVGGLGKFHEKLVQMLVFGAAQVYGPHQTVVRLLPALLPPQQQQQAQQQQVQQQQQMEEEGDEGLEEGEAGAGEEEDEELL
jgi:hypothetical protein